MPFVPTPASTALLHAEMEWRRDVRDGPPSAEIIDEYIRGKRGLGWSTVEVGEGARRDIAYQDDGDFEWCGAFVAYCWGGAGILPEIRFAHFSSAYRLWRWALRTERYRPLDDVQAGDVCLVGAAPGTRIGPAKKANPWGSHVTLCAETPLPGARFIRTIEGNAVGVGPTRDRIQGVIKRTRPFDAERPTDRRILHVIRPTLQDCAHV